MSEPQVRWHGQVLVIGDGDSGGECPPALLDSLPVEPSRRTVLVLEPVPANGPALAQLLTTWLPPGIRSVRLALSRATNGGLAQQLAERLDIEVVSSDGPVVALPAGTLFVTSATGVGGWWTHRPGLPAQRHGPHHPAVGWPVELPKRQRLRRPALTAHAVPCGFWLRSPSGRPVTPDDAAYAIPPDPDRPTVLIGRPGDRPVSVKALYEWLAALPQPCPEGLTLMPYGQDGQSLDEVAAKLSDALLITVQRTAGVPALDADGASVYATVGGDGQPRAMRIVQRVSYHSRLQHNVEAWLNPLTGRIENNPARVPLGRHWVLEVVRSGLWLHDTTASDNHRVGARPADPDAESFVVDAAGDPHAEALARRIAANLPVDIAALLRWQVLDPPTGTHSGGSGSEPDVRASSFATQASSTVTTPATGPGPAAEPDGPPNLVGTASAETRERSASDRSG